MKAADFLIDETQRATEAFFDAARKVPADKLDWKPLDNGRSVLDQAREIAQSPKWGVAVVSAGKFEWDDEKMKAAQAERDQWKTLDDCEAACKQNSEKLYELIRSTPDNQLSETIYIPFGKDHNWRVIDILHLQAWNLHYHTGQINYIQTLYGDTSM